MFLSCAFTVAGIILLSVFLKIRVHEATATSTILKASTSFCFIAVAFSAIVSRGFSGDKLTYGILIAAGLILDLIGDILLDLKYAHSEHADTYTFSGMSAFILGHTMFLSAMVFYFYIRGNTSAFISSIIIAPLSACLCIFGEKLLKVNYGKFKAISAIYTIFLACFPAFARNFASLYGYKNIGIDIMFFSGILFIISDAILNSTYFGIGKNKPIHIISNHITYYIAQFLVAYSLFFLDKTI